MTRDLHEIDGFSDLLSWLSSVENGQNKADWRTLGSPLS